MKYWKKLIVISIIMIILVPNISYSEDDENINTKEILENQESTFEIKNFLKEAEEYSKNTLELDISNIFKSAINGNIDNAGFFKKVLSLLGSEVLNTFKILINILVVILIHSLLKSMTDNLENSNISKMVYYAEYILIVTIIMANFGEILNSINKTTEI